MKLNAGIITNNLVQTRSFYVDQLWFGVTFESEWYILHTPNHESQIAFLLPSLESQSELFRDEFRWKGVFFTIEIDDVDDLYKTLQSKGIAIAVALRDEEWWDRHFAIVDPNGIGIDFVSYHKPLV